MTVFLFLLCAIAAILLMGGYYTYRIAFYSPKKGRGKISTFASHKYDPYRKEINRLFCQLSDRPYEEVSIVSFDGLTLFGRYYHVKDGAPLDIGFHGYRSSALTDFAGGSELSFSMGHNLLLTAEAKAVPSPSAFRSGGTWKAGHATPWSDSVQMCRLSSTAFPWVRRRC